MDFSNRIQLLAARIPKQLEHIHSVEGTKRSLVLPFVASLGYDIFDSAEVTTELGNRLGVVAEEGVDLAVFLGDEPVLLVECKETLAELVPSHGARLPHLFARTPARIGVLTNGVLYRFYTDLDTPRRMDAHPFFEFDILKASPEDVETLRAFSKDEFSTSQLVEMASRRRLTREIKRLLAAEIQQPSEAFLRFWAAQLRVAEAPLAVKRHFPALVREALTQFVAEQGATSRMGGREHAALPALPARIQVERPDPPARGPSPLLPVKRRAQPIVRRVPAPLVPVAPPPPVTAAWQRPLVWMLGAANLLVLFLLVAMIAAPPEAEAEPASSRLPVQGTTIVGQQVRLEPSVTRPPTATAEPIVLVVTATPAAPQFLETSLRFRVTASEDDAEETVADGTMNLASTDLELVGDGENTAPQLVGLRFQEVKIPPGATISQAYLRFTTDEPSRMPTSLRFNGEATESAAPFEWSAGNISQRVPTEATVVWEEVPPWFREQETHQSPDLSPIIQEIVSRPGWQSGNALVFIISGAGERTASAFDAGPDAAPVLHIAYSTKPEP